MFKLLVAHQEKDEWKYFMMEDGERYVMIASVWLMHRFHFNIISNLYKTLKKFTDIGTVTF